jgi:hypothetical protein
MDSTMGSLVLDLKNKQGTGSLPVLFHPTRINPNVTVDARDLELDNGLSRAAWPWDYYIGQSKAERIILSLLHDRDLPGINGVTENDVWRGAVSLQVIKRLLFKGKRMTNSQRASLSRTIRRLEHDGLIHRERAVNDNGYTTHIGLTQRGFYQAEFNRSEWYSLGKEVELLRFWGLTNDKYGQKVTRRYRKAKVTNNGH